MRGKWLGLFWTILVHTKKYFVILLPHLDGLNWPDRLHWHCLLRHDHLLPGHRHPAEPDDRGRRGRGRRRHRQRGRGEPVVGVPVEGLLLRGVAVAEVRGLGQRVVGEPGLRVHRDGAAAAAQVGLAARRRHGDAVGDSETFWYMGCRYVPYYST